MAFRTRPAILRLALAAAVLLAPTLGHADKSDHDAVRRAVESGEIRSLTDILKTIRDKLPGEIVGVHVEHENNHWTYEFRVIDPKGRVFDIHVDAQRGEIERIKEK